MMVLDPVLWWNIYVKHFFFDTEGIKWKTQKVSTSTVLTSTRCQIGMRKLMTTAMLVDVRSHQINAFETLLE